LTAGPVQQTPNGAEELYFQVIEERWNEYELQYGIFLNARTVLYKVFGIRGPNPGQTQIKVATQNIFSTRTLGQRGPPSPMRPEEISGQVEVERRPLRIERGNEPWNIYVVPQVEERIRTRLMIKDVFLVPNRFDNFGYPALIIQAEVTINIEQRM
jgi:hypothetical protein